MRQLLVTGASIALIGCSTPFYTGDGDFTEGGIFGYKHYVIGLGLIDLSESNSRSYTLSGMRHANCKIAIDVLDRSLATSSNRPSYPVIVKMLLENEEKQTVINENAPLDSWRMGFSGSIRDGVLWFFRDGERQEIPLADGGSTYKHIGVKASGGWGTYFVAEDGEKYQLAVEVIASKIGNPTQLNATLNVTCFYGL
jgi:hypothetical protein